MKKSYFYFLFLIVFSFINHAQDNFEVGGYAKYLFSTSDYPQIESRLYDHIIHSRLNTKYFFDNSFSATAEFRVRAFFGNSIKKVPDYSELIKTEQPLINLDKKLWNTQFSLGYAEIDRLFLDYNVNDFQITVGRQRIAWGTSWVWNPTDLFNPLSILDFDYEEFPGSDAFRLQYYTGAISKIELAVAPNRNNKKLTAAGLISYNVFDYDFNFIAGVKNRKWIAGFSWVGDIADAGFRGEIIVRDKPENDLKFDNIYSFYKETSLSSFDNLIISFVLSTDYTFPNSFYIHTEVLYNNLGKEKNTALFSMEAKEVGLLSPSRWSVYQEFSYNISPLTRTGIFGIYNPNDKSFVIVPSINYSVITNLDFYMIALFFEGNPLTQYGEYGSSVFLRLKYSF